MCMFTGSCARGLRCSALYFWVFVLGSSTFKILIGRETLMLGFDLAYFLSNADLFISIQISTRTFEDFLYGKTTVVVGTPEQDFSILVNLLIAYGEINQAWR